MPNQDFRVAVGEVAQAAAILEATVAIAAWGLAGLDQAIARIVVPNNMDRMLSLIRDLAEIRVADGQLRAEVLTWTSRVRDAYRERSRVLHATWVGPGDDSTHFRVDLRPLGRPLEYRTAAELLAIARDLELLATSEASFLGRLKMAVPGPWAVY